MSTVTQMDKIWLLSDTVLYPEAEAFMRHLMRNPNGKAISTSQMAGLLNVAELRQYEELNRFVNNQRSRNWPQRKQHIKIFYIELADTLKEMEKRLSGDFHLVDGSRKGSSPRGPEEDELLALVAREFIQHLVAENGLLVAKEEDERKRQSGQRAPQATQQRTGQQHRAERR